MCGNFHALTQASRWIAPGIEPDIDTDDIRSDDSQINDLQLDDPQSDDLHSDRFEPNGLQSDDVQAIEIPLTPTTTEPIHEFASSDGQ